MQRTIVMVYTNGVHKWQTNNSRTHLVQPVLQMTNVWDPSRRLDVGRWHQRVLCGFRFLATVPFVFVVVVFVVVVVVVVAVVAVGLKRPGVLLFLKIGMKR